MFTVLELKRDFHRTQPTVILTGDVCNMEQKLLPAGVMCISVTENKMNKIK